MYATLFLRCILMKKIRLNLYTIDIKYIRNLAKADSNILSVSPQTGKNSRPFVGIVLICNDKKYCIPLSSPKEKHKKMKNDVDFTKIYDKNNKLIGVLNFNNMIPVRNDVICPINLKILKTDNPSDIHYKNMVINQITFCRHNQSAIIRKANKLYKMITQNTVNTLLKRRCCNFLKLEKILEKYKTSLP